MGLLGSILGNVVGGVAGVVGAIGSSSAANKGYSQAIETLQQRYNEAADHRRNQYYQDPTKTAENQAAITQAQEILDDKTQQIDNTNIVSGGTDEAKALSKQVAANAVGNMMQQQAVEGAKQKEDIWKDNTDQMNTFAKYIADAKSARGLAKAKAWTEGAQGFGHAAVDTGSAFDLMKQK